MSDLIIGAKPPKPAPPPQRCENCFYAGAIDGQPQNRVCGALPPMMFLIGMGQDPLGRPVPQTINMRPVLNKDERRCSKWQPQGAAPGEQTQ